MSYFFSSTVVSYITELYRSSSRRHLITRAQADPTKGLTINITKIILDSLYSLNKILMCISDIIIGKMGHGNKYDILKLS
jgi:hypothetical protein